MGVSHCRVSKPKQDKGGYVYKMDAWSGCQSLDMLRQASTWVGDNPEFSDIRARVMQGGYTHKSKETHMYTSQTLFNDKNWEIMNTYQSHILDSKFHFPLKLFGISRRNC